VIATAVIENENVEVLFQSYVNTKCTRAYVLVSGAGVANDAFCGRYLNQKEGDVLSGTLTGKLD
jgi:hypothetical protein